MDPNNQTEVAAALLEVESEIMSCRVSVLRGRPAEFSVRLATAQRLLSEIATAFDDASTTTLAVAGTRES